MIESIATGLVYTNPQPNLRAVHAWHPSLVKLDEQEYVCAFDLGQAVESFDYCTYLARSTDGGRTWGTPVRLFHDSIERPTTHTVRISRLNDGRLLGVGARFYRDDPNSGLTNRATLGYVPQDLIMLHSQDAGRTWLGPSPMTAPLDGPCFEVCHSILELTDGRLLWPTQTWPDWSGRAPHGMKAIALVSFDGGTHWTEYLDVFNGTPDGIIHFEQSVVELRGGQLLAAAWAYKAATQTTFPTPYAVARDGRQFSAPRPTGLHGQTAKLLALDDRHVLCVYRRDDRPGLWAQLAMIEGERWTNLYEFALWQGAQAAQPARTASDHLSGLKFGYPGLVRISAAEVLVVFWCEENSCHNIRWFRVRIDPP